jgi:superfamily II DNA or RNA helicase
MQPVNFDPEVGYRNEYLWLPLRKISNLQGIKNTLSFTGPDGKTSLHSWVETDHHLRVPRAFIPFERWPDLPFDIEDVSLDTFPEVDGVEVTCKLYRGTQENAYKAMLEQGSGVLSLACGKGKTVVALHAWAATKVPGLVVVHTKDLMEQWIDRICEHTNIERDEVGVFQGKSKKPWDKIITVAMIQTLVARVKNGELPEGFREHFGVFIFDEVHHLGAPGFNTVAPLGRGTRWGLSATPDRSDGLEKLYQYHLGKILFLDHVQDVIPEIFFLETNTYVPDDVMSGMRDRTGDVNLAYLLTHIALDEDRNDYVCQWVDKAVKDERKILVLCPRVEQVEILYARFMLRTDISVGMIHGKIKSSDRKEKLATCDLIFATTVLAKEGLDRKDLDTLILVSPVADENIIRQILGRIQRPHNGKSTPTMLVMKDQLVTACSRMCQKIGHHMTKFGYPYTVVRRD